MGFHLVRLLHREGARLVVTDIDPEGVRQVVRETGIVSVFAIASREGVPTSVAANRLAEERLLAGAPPRT